MRQLGKFRLVEHLASGGMADVWRAEMPGAAGFVKEVALKLIRGEHRQDDAFTRMFIQEARLASRLDHANVVHVFELGEVDGQYYIAMELVRGRTLREVVDRCREQGVRFGPARAVHVCAEVARALAYAHRLEVEGRPAEVVHRDVSPHNVLISVEGEVKLADFGIARAADADEQTRAGTIKGKLAYMAPEQARGEPVDGRADVFALGVVLWELCAGRRLFARDGDAATLAAVLDGPISRPSEWNETIGPDLDAAVLAALERDRERRIRSDELARRLAALRVQLAAPDPEQLDLRALLLKLWPEGAAPATRREPTAVMSGPPVPVVAEPAVDPRDAPTRTLTRPRPFEPERPGQQGRRSLLLLCTVVFAIALAAGVLRWAGAGSEPRTAPANEQERLRPPPPDGAASADASPPAPVASPSPSASDPAAPATQGAAPIERRPTPTRPPAGSGAGAASVPARPSATPGTRSDARASAPATLVVDVVPWAAISVDGKQVGDTPLTLELAPGTHQLRAVHPRFGSASARVRLSPGERLRWAPELRGAAVP